MSPALPPGTRALRWLVRTATTTTTTTTTTPGVDASPSAGVALPNVGEACTDSVCVTDASCTAGRCVKDPDVPLSTCIGFRCPLDNLCGT